MPVHEEKWKAGISQEADAEVPNIKRGSKIKNEHLRMSESSEENIRTSTTFRSI